MDGEIVERDFEVVMNALVTGATGFVGRYVVRALLERGHQVTAVSRNIDRAKSMVWYDKVRFVSCDIHNGDEALPGKLGSHDALIHLAWEGLDNYKDSSHLVKALPDNMQFLGKMIKHGTKHILVTGTCAEYGIQEGAMHEETETKPANAYGMAKDKLRRHLQELQNEYPFILQWVRLFYLYGKGQNPKSLLSQLDRAIDASEPVFNMSGGEQIRDYLPIEEAARRIALLAEHPEINGAINCCSEKPMSIRSFVEQHIASRGSNIKLNIGYYPYPDYESMSFWGTSKKLRAIL